MIKPQPPSFFLLACLACACGGNFEAGNGSGSGSAGAPQAGATANGGDTSTGASAGESAGGSSAAGDSSSGGLEAAGSGGTAHAGAASGGSASGGAAGADCAALKTEYAALVKKARVCDEGSTDQCSTASKAPNVGGCGCATLVNANSEYTALAAAKYKAIQKGNCDSGGLTCAIACLPPTSARCAQSTGMGSPEFVCTGSSGGVAN